MTSPSAGFRSARWTTTCICSPAKASGAQLLIDAADDLAAIQGLLADAAADTSATPKLALIATTHQHWDHVRALPGLVEATGVKTAAGTDDAPELPVPVDVLLDHGDVGNFDGFDVTAVHLRGHTPGSIALVYQDPAGPGAHLLRRLAVPGRRGQHAEGSRRGLPS